MIFGRRPAAFSSTISTDFDRYAADYEEAVDRSISFTGRNASFFAEQKIDLLRRLLRAHGRSLAAATVLDVGCGTGVTDQYLVGSVRALHGVDISEEMLNVARSRLPTAKLKCYDGKKLPFPDGMFDVVVAICVLHHVPPPDQFEFVRELHRVAAPGGAIAIFEHNPFNALTRRAVDRCELDRGVRLLTMGDVQRLLSDTGSSVLERAYFLTTPFGGRLGSVLDLPFRRVPLGGQHLVIATVTS